MRGGNGGEAGDGDDGGGEGLARAMPDFYNWYSKAIEDPGCAPTMCGACPSGSASARRGVRLVHEIAGASTRARSDPDSCYLGIGSTTCEEEYYADDDSVYRTCARAAHGETQSETRKDSHSHASCKLQKIHNP